MIFEYVYVGLNICSTSFCLPRLAQKRVSFFFADTPIKNLTKNKFEPMYLGSISVVRIY